jgi:phenylacetate-coenzyme A ligase PaaK-like adenylate-forming protein
MASATAVLTLLAATAARRREQWLSPDELRELRVQRLQRLAGAAARAPYWAETFRRCGIRPELLDDGPALERLPILERGTLQDQTEALLTAPTDRLFRVKSSGSSGRPVRLYRSERDQAEISALHVRIGGVFGRRTFECQVSIGSGGAVASKGPVVMLRKMGLLPPMHRLLSMDPLDQQLATVRRLQPQVINGYSIALERLAEAAIDAGVTDIRPRLVYTGSMPTNERCRRLIEQAFGVRPLDVYAMVEAGPLAFECPESPGDYHLNDDVQLIEIVDEHGRRVPDGVTGEVVVTPLTLTGQPLLRYRVGDLAARRTHACRCGRGLALLSSVVGRSRDVIRTPDGRALNAGVLTDVFLPEEGIRRWQIRQTAADAVHALVVPGGTWSDHAHARTLERMRKRIGDGMRVELQLVREIATTSAGKFQTVVPLPSAREAVVLAARSFRPAPEGLPRRKTA